MLLHHHQHQYDGVAGRLMHHLKEVEGMSLRTVEYCVFDEADRLFEMGFAAQLREILAKMNESRQVSIPSGPHMLLLLGDVSCCCCLAMFHAAAAWPCVMLLLLGQLSCHGE